MSFRRRLMMGKGSKAQPDYLCFTALEDGTFTLSIPADLATGNFSYAEYSVDECSTWTKTNNVDSTAVTITTPTINAGDRVYWRGEGLRMGSSTSVYSKFSSTGTCDVMGNIESMLSGTSEIRTTPYTYSYHGLFYGMTTLIDAGSLILPMMSLEAQYYRVMFSGCTNLETAPELPATTLKKECYQYMCQGCTNLTTVPEILPAETLIQSCYYGMFQNCKALTTAPTLPALAGAQQCYSMMFDGCSALSYIKMLVKSSVGYNGLSNWMRNTPNTLSCIFVKHIDATWTTTGNSGVPTNWTVIYYDPTEDKYYTDQTKATECDDHGNPL